MKIEQIDMTEALDEDGDTFGMELECPECQKTWFMVYNEGDATDIEPCKHLKLQFSNEWGVSFGKFDMKAFKEAYKRAYCKVYDEELTAVDIENGLDGVVIEAMEEIEGLRFYVHLNEGMACGPVAFEVFYCLDIRGRKKKK